MLLEEKFLPILVIASSIFVSMILASALGMGITVLVHKLGLDPKFASGPIVLMCTDVITTTAYFSIASAMLL